MKKRSTRRTFLKVGSGVLCGLALAKSGQAIAAGKPAQNWTESFDVIVIGSGLAGLVSGISALENGAKKVVILEKMGMEGGSSAISNGTISVPGSPLQKEQGIDDSPEKMLADVMAAGNGYCHLPLTKALVDNGVEAFNYIVRHGAKFKNTVMQPGGMKTKRLLQPDNNSANGLLKPLRASFLRLGGKIITCCRADRLIQDESGAVTGVAVRTDYHFDLRLHSDDLENTTGTPGRYEAKKAVICCTGGFEADKSFRNQEQPQFSGAFTTEHGGATASGFRILAGAGARMIHCSLYRPAFPCTDEQPLGMMVDPASGKRFVREDAGRIPVFHAASKLLASNGNRIPLSILDQDAYELVPNKLRMQKNQDAGYVFKFDSLEALAKHFDIPQAQFMETIKSYNAMVKANKDTEFGADFTSIKGNIVDKAPFYAVQVRPNLTYSLGGALITPKAEVVSLATEKPISGLYAAGEATAGVHGGMRLGGCAILDCCVFGMLAGKNAARHKRA